MRFVRMLLSRWVLTFVGTALLAALVWLFGPFLDALADVMPRVLIIVAMFAVWAIVNLLLELRRRGRDNALTEGLTEGQVARAVDPSLAASAEETAGVKEKLARALALLKKARGTRGYLYEQPWYVIIGPPAAGKTTALLNAGLRFPLAAELGQAEISGVGGTRQFDWWFTDNAVLIDTAGRYTTQDSDAAVDKAGWTAFLDLLKRTRPRQPLNGVLVAIAVTDVAQASPEERRARARTIRQRIKDLEERLGVRLPVYAMFTKADLIAGFTEFFDDLDRERRNQVWGATFPLAGGEPGTAAQFAEEFPLIVSRLNERLLTRMQAERSPERRALLASFPSQVASLETPLAEFLTEAFGGSRLDPAAMLRGFYFVSGTQEGSPIDRLTGMLARSFGVDQRRAPSLRPERGRSYFLGRLLDTVVFGEAMLVSFRPGAARRRLLLSLGSYALVLLALLAGGAILTQSRAANQQSIASIEAALRHYQATALALPLDPVRDGDPAAVVPLLDEARALPFGYDSGRGGGAWFGAGLSQDDKLAAAARGVYRHALERTLLPRLLVRLEGQMRDNLSKPDFLYEATRVYLMLGNQGPLDRALVKAWMQYDWLAAYPGAAADATRASLAKHLDALLAAPLPEIPLDGALVADARAAFSRVSLAQRVYSRIKPSAEAQALAPWRPSDALGAAGIGAFIRASGKPLTEGVPGFLTVDGFWKVLLPQLAGAAREVASESWVLGRKEAIDPTSPQARALEHDVIALYEADYRAAWDGVLGDLDIAPLRNLQQAAQELYVLGSPQSPMRDLLTSIARQLTLSTAPAGVPGLVQGGIAAVAAKQLDPAVARAAGALGAAGSAPPPPGAEIDDHYKDLRGFVAGGDAAPVTQILKPINDLQQQLAKLAQAPAGSAPPPAALGSDPALVLRTEALRQPQPVGRWLAAIAGSGTALRGGGAKAQAADAFNGPAGPANLCKQAVANHYPFFATATDDTPLADFATLFAPGKRFDSFFTQQIRPFIDMSSDPWKALNVDGVPPPVSAADLAMFKRASQIRDQFFTGGDQPSIHFTIKPVSMDPGARQVTLDFGGITVTNTNGPPITKSVVWPGDSGMQMIRLTFDPAPSGGSGAMTFSGTWALFRLLAAGHPQRQGAGEHMLLTYKVGERVATFDIAAESVLNPLDPSLLQGFRCPTMQ